MIVNREDDSYKVDLTLNAKAGKSTRISRIILKGNNVTKDDVILREINIKPGSKYNQSEIDKIPRTLNKLGYFKQVNQPKFVFAENKKLALLIGLEEGNTTTFDGVIGYIPEAQSAKKSSGYFTGLLNATFRNMFGTGRKFAIFWQKPDEFSDQFKLYYEEPWIFNLPINLGIGLERLVRDTTYIERTYFLNSSLRLSSTLIATFAVSQKSTIPDSLASRALGLTRNINSSVELGIEYDTRDYPINPRSGVLYSTHYAFGQKQNTGPSYLLSEDNIIKNEQLQKVQVDLEYYLPLLSNQLLFFHIYGAQIKSNENQLQLTDHIWFGGARSLRGYRENNFHGSVVSWLNLEYRFLIGRNSRLFFI
ncbi:BamA/TamA family outer membrane protein [Calditrichota bacterium]